MLAIIDYPDISPELFRIGPIAIRWYALAYIGGLVIGLLYVQRLAAWAGRTLFEEPPISRDALNDLLLWVTLGVVLGGRVGYVIFYQPGYFVTNPLEIFAVWNGGMSFHGGLLGVAVAVVLFTWRRNIELLKLADIVACGTPVGLFLGRVANFVNGELYGRPTNVDWAMIFPRGGPVPRHPSQLYEAFLEGIVLFIVVGALYRFTSIPKRPGIVTGIFFIGYGLSRFTVEFFREPDAHLGFLFAGATMGQLLSLPMVLIGMAFILYRPERRAI